MKTILTIGHSSHSIESFLDLLRRHEVTAIADVRSHPYSRHAPQYSRESLRAALSRESVGYVFLGEELGGRSPDPACYKEGQVEYSSVARQDYFLQGIARVIDGAHRHNIALMCSEKDPANCHRALLVGRKLHEQGLSVAHILANGEVERHGDLETRLLELSKLGERDMFRSRAELVVEAYAIQAGRVAYQDSTMEGLEKASGA